MLAGRGEDHGKLYFPNRDATAIVKLLIAGLRIERSKYLKGSKYLNIIASPVQWVISATQNTPYRNPEVLTWF